MDMSDITKSIAMPEHVKARAASHSGNRSSPRVQAGLEYLPLALMCLLLCFAWRHGLSQSPWVQSRFEIHKPSTDLVQADPLGVPSVAKAPAQAKAVQSLSPEQLRIVDFIVDRYQAASDLARDIVHESYAIAREQKLDPLLILAMVAVESGFDPLAQSPRGAQGLMQILTRVHAAKFEHLGGVAAVFDPVSNLRVGVGILKEYLIRDASLEKALKTYVGAANLPSDHGYGQRVLLARSKFEQAASQVGP